MLPIRDTIPSRNPPVATRDRRGFFLVWSNSGDRLPALTGGGVKQVTVGIVVAGTAMLDDGAETSLVYGSEAIAQQTRSMPLRILTWRDVLPTTH